MKRQTTNTIKFALFFGALLIAMAGQADLSTGLNGYWQMDDSPVDSANPTIAATTGVDGTLVDSETGDRSVAGKIDDAIKFWKPGGYQAHADMGSGYAAGTGSYSVNFWWNAAGSTGGLMNNGNWGSTVDGLSLHLIGTRNIYARFRSGTNSDDIAVVTGASLGAWYMLTMTVDRDADTITLYHNGGEASGSASIAGWGSLDGAGDVDSKTYFASVVDGNTGVAASASYTTLDEVAIWDRALSTTEISDLYNGGAGQVIPEPTTLGLLSMVGVGLVGLRKHMII